MSDTCSDLDSGKTRFDDEPVVPLPPPLQKIVDLFESLPDEEKRENLILYADAGQKVAPKEGETFDLEDIRKDEECADTVGVFLKVSPAGQATFRVSLGHQVQTLTKAMTAILCKGLEGSTPQEVISVPSNFVPRIVGGQLVRVRSQTTYYVLTRMKGICKVYLDRLRTAKNGTT
jgi:cysteine desulfuration protein SufE